MSGEFAASGIDEPTLVGLARRLAVPLGAGGTVYLRGDLGAGKTTFARALLQALGVGERVKSPTYSLIESYRSGDLRVHHLDLYRIADADELEWLGLGDLVALAIGLGVENGEGVDPLFCDWGLHAEGLLQAMVLELPARYEGPIEFPMKTVAQAARHALLRVAGGADPGDVMTIESWRHIVAGCGHQALMAIVTAMSPRLKRSGSRA